MKKYVFIIILSLNTIGFCQNVNIVKEDKKFSIFSQKFGYERQYELWHNSGETSGDRTYYYFGPFGVQTFYTTEIVFMALGLIGFIILIVIAIKKENIRKKIIQYKKIIAITTIIFITLTFSYMYYISNKISGTWISEDGQFTINFKDEMDIEYIELIQHYVVSPSEILLVRKNGIHPRELNSIQFIGNNKIKYYFSSCGNVPPIELTKK